MTVYYVPVLQPVEFARFRALCNDSLADDFDAWAVAQDRRRRGLVAGGHHVIGVYVAPDDFRRHCRSANCAADPAALDALATGIGRRIYEDDAAYRRARAERVVVEETRSGRSTPAATAAAAPAPRRRWFAWRRPSFLVRIFRRRRPVAAQPAE
ncbi:MAG TPA: hypothetical protein VMB84_01640 [Stellaceae bacterium]|nr:hypothetical protein [Stellaceae bacterium]